MDEDNKVVADARETFGKGAARKIRAAGKIPAVVYGHGTDPQHITLPAHQVGLLIRKANAVLDLQIDRQEPARPRQGRAEGPGAPDHRAPRPHRHQARARRSRSRSPCTSRASRTPAPSPTSTPRRCSLEVEATHIPESIVVSIEGLEDGTQIHAKDVELPKGATLISDAETLVVLVHVPQKVDLGEEAAEAAAAEAAAEAPEAEAEAEAESAE